PKSLKKPLVGYRYSGSGAAGDPCTAVVIKDDVVKATCKGKGVTLAPPFAGAVSVALTVGEDDQTFCCSFGGTEVKNQSSLLKRRTADAPHECAPSTTTTTLEEATTSTTMQSTATTSTTMQSGEETTSTTMMCDNTTTSTTMACGGSTTTTLAGG